MTDNKKPVLVKVSERMAKSKDMPVYFIGVPYIETAKAYKFKGEGTLVQKINGNCSICGKELTNPNSIKLGIGPICANNMGINLLNGYTNEDIEKEMSKIKIDTFLPKSCVELLDTKGLIIPDIKISTEDRKPKEQPKKLVFEGGLINIFFPFDFNLLNKVKSLSGRRYQKEPAPHWTCPDTKQNQLDLTKMGFDVPEIKKEEIKIPNFPSHLLKVLFPYQKEGVQFIYDKNGRCLIGDCMGLGKTIQALTYIEMNPKINHILIVCPASLKLNWAAEIRKWMTDYNLAILSGKKATLKNWENGVLVTSKTAQKHITIINYDIISDWLSLLKQSSFDLVIADEIHFAKNRNAKRTKAVIELGKKFKQFIGLSGTPIINRPVEFFNALNLINPNLFSSFWTYTKKYCAARHTRFGWDFSGSSNTDELHRIVSEVMIRRKKEDVLKELPPKIRTVVPLEIDNRKEYNEAEDNVLNELEEAIKAKVKKIRENEKLSNKQKKEAIYKAGLAKNAAARMVMERLKQKAVQGKMGAVKKWIKDYLETENKLVIFATHTKTLDLLEEEFGGICVRIDGSVKTEDRQKAVEDFQENSKIRLFLGNIKAAGVGLTLTAANATCFIEFPWTIGDVVQGEDRVHRIGQTSDSVHAYFLTATKTIDEDIMELLEQKGKVLDAILDGTSIKSGSIFNELLKRLNRKGN